MNEKFGDRILKAEWGLFQRNRQASQRSTAIQVSFRSVSCVLYLNRNCPTHTGDFNMFNNVDDAHDL